MNILIGLTLLLRIAGLVMAYTHQPGSEYVTFASYVSFVVLLVFLLRDIRSSFYTYSIVLLSGIVGMIGTLFKIMHWPSSGILIMISMGGMIFSGILLVWGALNIRKNKALIYQLLLALFIILQCLTPLYPTNIPMEYLKLMHYPIVALSGTILLNKQSIHRGEKNMLIFILIQSLFFILAHTFALLK